MFTAKYSRTKVSSNRNQILVSSLLSYSNNSNFKGPRVFFFIPRILVILLINISIAISLANRKRGVIVDIILNKNGLFTAYKNRFLY
jgi:hypothetical protein